MLTALMLVLGQACTDPRNEEALAELEVLQQDWNALHSAVVSLGDSLDSLLIFCSNSERKLKKDALNFASLQKEASERLESLSSAFAEDNEKIAAIAEGYEAFALDWKRLSKELLGFKEKLEKAKVSQPKTEAELEFFKETLINAETIVAGLKGALDESAINIRQSLAEYEKQARQ